MTAHSITDDLRSAALELLRTHDAKGAWHVFLGEVVRQSETLHGSAHKAARALGCEYKALLRARRLQIYGAHIAAIQLLLQSGTSWTQMKTQFMRVIVEAGMERAHGNQVQAAKALKIHRNSIRRILGGAQ
jgi:DNA-binding NtrC family response regulator